MEQLEYRLNKEQERRHQEQMKAEQERHEELMRHYRERQSDREMQGLRKYWKTGSPEDLWSALEGGELQPLQPLDY